jgi:LPXTG-site transpeptidase (sortase) family protein
MTKGFFGFAFTFVAFFMLSYIFMAMVDALPEPIKDTAPTEKSITETATSVASAPEAPVRVIAPSIGMDNTVLNPQSTDVATLDEALLEGTVRYPTSAQLGEDGTVLLFGHSSYLPIVRNQNYKAFNGIQKLKEGETVSVYSTTHEYRYTVTGVRMADASEDVVELPTNGKFLTLITCDSFGKKSSRFIVTATFAGSYSI